MFHGAITALITPFCGENSQEIDWDAFEKIIEFQIDGGIHGLVPCGTTGESPTLSHDEQNQIIKKCVEITNGRVPVIAGCGSNSTLEAIELTTHASKAGADAALIVTPYYNKPTQAGLLAHYLAIHDASNIPIIIYNIPGRCVIDMTNETLAELSKLPRIVGVKDATGDLGRVTEVAAICGADFVQLSGNDDTAAGFLAQGGHGCISVVSNILPKTASDMQNAWRCGNIEDFQTARDALAPLSKSLFMESSPAPVKYVASKLGLCSEDVRLPLLPATKGARETLDRIVL